MKPASIVQFDRFYLGSIIVWLIGVAVGWDNAVQQMNDNPAFAANPNAGAMIPGILIGTVVLGVALSLLFWWLVSKRASVVGKWIITILFGISALALPFALIGWEANGLLNTALSLVVFVLTLFAVIMLFRADATAWFRGPAEDEPADRTFG